MRTKYAYTFFSMTTLSVAKFLHSIEFFCVNIVFLWLQCCDSADILSTTAAFSR